MILLGTSGFSFPDWDGVFYPPGLERARQFDYYVRQFRAVEINSTYYRVPPPSTMATLERKSPPGFEFVVKANQEMTHKQSYSPELYEAFHASVAPLVRARKMSGVLAQFPQAFHRNENSERFLVEFQERMEGIPLFVEFRHNSWMHEDVFEFLAGKSLGYVSVDEPDLPGLLPPVARATGPLAYVRFHGRNKRNWYTRDEGAADRAAEGGNVRGGRNGRGSGPGGRSEPGRRASGGSATGLRRAGLAADRPVGAAKSPGAAAKPPSRDRRLLRYDYLYSESELREWAEKIRELNQKTQKTFVFFNNCHAGHAATGAKLMRKLLELPEPAVAEQTGLL